MEAYSAIEESKQASGIKPRLEKKTFSTAGNQNRPQIQLDPTYDDDKVANGAPQTNIDRDQAKLEVLDTYMNQEPFSGNFMNKASSINSAIKIRSQQHYAMPGSPRSRQARVNISSTSHGNMNVGASSDSSQHEIFETPKN